MPPTRSHEVAEERSLFEHCLSLVGSTHVCQRLSAEAVLRLAGCSAALRRSLVDRRGRLTAGSLQVWGASAQVALRQVVWESMQVVVVRVGSFNDVVQVLRLHYEGALPSRLVVGVDAPNIWPEAVMEFIRQLAGGANHHLSIGRTLQPPTDDSWDRITTSTPERFMSKAFSNQSWLHLLLPSSTVYQWPLLQNLPSVQLHPTLRTLSLNLSHLDLMVMREAPLDMPHGIRELYLRFSTWLPVAASFSGDFLHLALMPQGLELLHITFDWRDMLGIGAKALPAILPDTLRHLKLMAKRACFPEGLGLVALGCLPHRLVTMDLNLSRSRGVWRILTRLATGMPPQLESLAVNLSWSDVNDGDACTLIGRLPPSLQNLSLELSHCRDLPRCPSELARHLPESLVNLSVSFAYTQVLNSALAVLACGLPCTLRRASVDLSGNCIKVSCKELKAVLPPSMESMSLVLHDAVIHPSLACAAASRPAASTGTHSCLLRLRFTKCQISQDDWATSTMPRLAVLPLLDPLPEEGTIAESCDTMCQSQAQRLPAGFWADLGI